MENDAIKKSFAKQLEICHDPNAVPIKPIETQIEGNPSEIPMMLPAVDNEELRPLLMAWYYAGYYTGRYQALNEKK